MTSGARAWLGAAIGALAVLMLHPQTKHYYRAGLYDFGASSALSHSYYVESNVRVVRPPQTKMDAAYWMLIAANVNLQRKEVSRKAIETLAESAIYYRGQDSGNAFWPQMESYFWWELGRKDKSVEAWLLAGKQLRWNDYQNDRLEVLSSALIAEEGRAMGWHSAALYTERSNAIAQSLLLHAHRIWGYGRDHPGEKLTIQAALLRNGVLFRDDARNYVASRFGTEMIELAAVENLAASRVTNRVLILNRFAFVDRLRTSGRQGDAALAERAFRENDAFPAILQVANAERSVRQFAWIGLLSATIPGAAMWIALAGLGTLGLGRLIVHRRWFWFLSEPNYAATFGIVVGLLTYFATTLAWLALLPVLVFGYQTLRREGEADSPTSEMGPLFGLIVGVLTAFLGIALLALLVGLTPPFQQLYPLLAVPHEYGPGSLFLVGLILFVPLTFLSVGVTWGRSQRKHPMFVTGQAVLKSGRILAWTFLAISIFSGPVAFIADRHARDHLSKIVANETRYYTNYKK